MKNATLFTLLTLALWASASAQEDRFEYRNNFMIGLKGGVNYSNIVGNQIGNIHTDAKTFMVGGAQFSVPLSLHWGLQPEALMGQRGFTASGSIQGNTFQFDRIGSYIDVPLLIAYKPGMFITLVAGPQYSYLLNQQDIYANIETGINPEQKVPVVASRQNMLCGVVGLDWNVQYMIVGIRIGADLVGDGFLATSSAYKTGWCQVSFGFRY